MVTSISVIRNPADDPEFERAVQELVESGVRDPEEAQLRLRDRYPHALVRPRELTGESTLVWYVYREGRWIPGK